MSEAPQMYIRRSLSSPGSCLFALPRRPPPLPRAISGSPRLHVWMSWAL